MFIMHKMVDVIIDPMHTSALTKVIIWERNDNVNQNC